MQDSTTEIMSTHHVYINVQHSLSSKQRDKNTDLQLTMRTNILFLTDYFSKYSEAGDKKKILYWKMGTFATKH